MIKLTRLDGIPTFINPKHIVSVTEGKDGSGETMTCVYTLATSAQASVEFVREASRRVAEMCNPSATAAQGWWPETNHQGMAVKTSAPVAEKTLETADSDNPAISE